jgi:arylsulfatase A-like enzyme
MLRFPFFLGVALSHLLIFPLTGAVEMTPPGGLVREGEFVTLSAGATDTIRYTLDGSEPGLSSPVYTEPLRLEGAIELKALAFPVSGDPGEVTGSFFVTVPSAPPNVLLIVADDLGYNDLGCYGAPTVATPRLDGLARSGCRFTQFTNTGPGDLACQFALLTGRLAKRGGLPELAGFTDQGVDPREWTLGEAFRKSGYDTAFIGEWHLGGAPTSRPDAQGFRLFFGLPSAIETAPPLVENDTVIENVVDEATLMAQLRNRALSFLREDREEPFLMVFQVPPLSATGQSYLGEAGNRIESIDALVGSLIDEIEEEELTGETLVIFLSDEGADRRAGLTSTGSNGQLRDGKGTTWEGGVRPPMIVRWPGVVPAGTDSRSLVWMPDVYPSLIDLIQSYTPANHFLDGENTVTQLLGADRGRTGDRQLFLYRYEEGGYEATAIRQGQWKMHRTILNLDPENDSPASASSLFDVEVDPSERINFSSVERNLIRELRREIISHEAGFPADLPDLPESRDAFLETPKVSVDLSGGAGPQAVIEYLRPADPLEDHYLIQWSHDLLGWTDEPSSPYLVSVTREGDEERVVLAVPLQNDSQTAETRFLRLKSIRP